MSSRVVWSPKAKADLDEIWAHYALAADIDIADRIIDRLYERVERLHRFPERAPRAVRLRPNLRALQVTPYVVYYEAEPGVVHCCE